MDRNGFNEMITRVMDHLIDISNTKGRDYAGNEDALRHFRDTAERVQLTPERVLLVKAFKHWDAIVTYCTTGYVSSENIEGRINDMLMYLLHLHAMVQERDGVRYAALGTPTPTNMQLGDINPANDEATGNPFSGGSSHIGQATRLRSERLGQSNRATAVAQERLSDPTGLDQCIPSDGQRMRAERQSEAPVSPRETYQTDTSPPTGDQGSTVRDAPAYARTSNSINRAISNRAISNRAIDATGNPIAPTTRFHDHTWDSHGLCTYPGCDGERSH